MEKCVFCRAAANRQQRHNLGTPTGTYVEVRHEPNRRNPLQHISRMTELVATSDRPPHVILEPRNNIPW